MNVGAPELLIVFVVVALIFGPAKLPGLARSLGEAVSEFKASTVDRHDQPPDGSRDPS
jgi:TatA/E family protein of Tat protein translocase